MCYYCHWGLPPKAAKVREDHEDELYALGYGGDEVESFMEYGPGHVVWCDFNLHCTEIKECQLRRGTPYDIPLDAHLVVLKSIVALGKIPWEDLAPHPDYDRDDTEMSPIDYQPDWYEGPPIVYEEHVPNTYSSKAVPLDGEWILNDEGQVTGYISKKSR